MVAPDLLQIAAARFKAAKAELVACGLPPDVVDAALRPLWNSIRITLASRPIPPR